VLTVVEVDERKHSLDGYQKLTSRRTMRILTRQNVWEPATGSFKKLNLRPGLIAQSPPCSGVTENVGSKAEPRLVALLPIFSWRWQVCTHVSLSTRRAHTRLMTYAIYRSNVLEHITTEYALRKDTGISFSYYDYKVPELGDPCRIISALIKQLCRKKGTMPRDLLRFKLDSLRPSFTSI
jgi:hypothetical protein